MNPDIVCHACQIASNQGTKGAYNFNCMDCRVRYSLDCIDRLSPSLEEAAKAKDKLFEELLKWRAGQ